MTWDDYFMGFALWAAKRSTCIRKNVGAVLVHENKIISTGYNGVVSKAEHCKDFFLKKYEKYYNRKYRSFEDYLISKEFYDEHGEFSKKNELHAEMNCLAFSYIKDLKGCEIFLTLSPCYNCSKLLLANKISRVVFLGIYDRDTCGLQLLKDNEVLVDHYENKQVLNKELESIEEC